MPSLVKPSLPRAFRSKDDVPNFSSILSGSPQSRLTDNYGSGQYLAWRDGHSRRHHGLDVVAKAGETVFSPIDGNIVREAAPYFPFTGVLIEGAAKFKGYSVKLFYVENMRACGFINAGAILGNVDDLRKKYRNITNHVHVEVRWQGKLVNPFDTYRMCF